MTGVEELGRSLLLFFFGSGAVKDRQGLFVFLGVDVLFIRVCFGLDVSYHSATLSEFSSMVFNGKNL